MAGPAVTSPSPGPGATPADGGGARDATSRLDEWLETHGPLSPAESLVVALRACSTAAGLTDARLSAVLPSLQASGVERLPGRGWSWRPVASVAPGRAVAEGEVVERVGALLFECLTGRPLAQRFTDEAAVRRQLGAVRPDLPPLVADLAARAAMGRDSPDACLAALAVELRTALGARASRLPVRRRRIAAGLLGVAALAAVAMSWQARAWREAGPRSHALTAQETAVLDATMESADQLAVTDEHTAAIQRLASLEPLWLQRVDVVDPRLAWSRARQAWVRQLSGDRLTAEQLLEPYLVTVSAALGAAHPYTRTLQLDLAGVVEARGALTQAASLRAQAARAMTGVVPAPTLRWQSVGVPWPPHTLAHVTPNEPEREGFRRGREGGFLLPLTSTQRWLAGRDGWHLHVRATGTCRVSLVTGADPRRIGIDVTRAADGAWAAGVDGSSPRLAMTSPAADRFAVTVSVDAAARLTVRLADGSTHAAGIDHAAPPPPPPFALAFGGQPDASACAVVWWEIAAR